MKWTNEQPPIGVWAYSVTEGVFRIERKTETAYLEVISVRRFDRHRLETGTTYTVHINGPFIYPLPDPTKGVKE
jgi:hypothetical protein